MRHGDPEDEVDGRARQEEPVFRYGCLWWMACAITGSSALGGATHTKRCFIPSAIGTKSTTKSGSTAGTVSTKRRSTTGQRAFDGVERAEQDERAERDAEPVDERDEVRVSARRASKAADAVSPSPTTATARAGAMRRLPPWYGEGVIVRPPSRGARALGRDLVQRRRLRELQRADVGDHRPAVLSDELAAYEGMSPKPSVITW